MIFATYYSVIYYTKIIVIESPEFSEYSDLIQHPSLKCPCSTIAIKYDKFIRIEPEYHELCQSDFISNEWINHLFKLYQQSWNKSISSDFRRIGFFQFQTIRSLCQLANGTIKENLQSFLYTEFIQLELISQERFQAQISSFIQDFIQATPKTFLRTLQFVQDTTAQSLFMTGASLTSVRPIPQYRIRIDNGFIPYPGMNYTFTDGSTCVCSASTATTCMGLATFGNDTVSGFQTGCYMLSALMNSTLEAFYNQTIVDKLSNSSGHFQKLNSSDSNSTVEMLLSQMFVKFWSNSTSYETYFLSCAPSSCQYIINYHYNLWAIITLLLISLFGGLSSALRIITPIITVHVWPFVWKVISRRLGHVQQIVTVGPIPEYSMGMRIKMLLQWMKRKLLTLNLFQSVPPSQDETVLRQQRHQTRIYLVLLLIGLSILIVFTSVRPNQITITVESPSSGDFNSLYERYPLTLNCPCSQTTLEYNKFISYIKPEYYEICLSEFVTSDWINLQFVKSPARVFFTNDIRYQSQIHFQLLSTLCRIANQTIKENLQSFYQTKLVTTRVLNPSSFQTQVGLIFDQFKRSVPESYQVTLQLIQANSEINQFIVPLNSEFIGTTDDDDDSFYIAKPALHNREYAQMSYCLLETAPCACVNVSGNKCILRTIIAKGNNIVKIPGMFQTFFPLQSVLMSTLECFYHDTCLSQITRLIDPIILPTNFSTLRLSLLLLNDTQYDQIDILANKTFIQSWNNQSSYESYFNQCHPLTCEYTYESRFNIIYIVTTFLGLVGGLNIALRLFVSRAVELMPRIWKTMFRRKRNNAVLAVEAASIKSKFFHRLRALMTYIKRSMIELNLFSPIPPSQDEKIIRRGRIITRIYLVLLLISIFILAIYTSLTQEKVTVIVKSPSISKYLNLFNKYSPTLECPCSQIIVKYDKFITQVEPEYHPICSSVFVSSNWSDTMYYIAIALANTNFVNDDFRIYAKTQFETVAKMCSLSRKRFDSALSTWLQTDFITANVISPTEFNIQIKGLIEEFRRKTPSQFIQTFKLIQTINHANQLASTYSSNWKFVGSLIPSNIYLKKNRLQLFDLNIVQTALKMLSLPQTYGDNGCSCALQSNCSKLSSLPHRTSNQSLKQTLPGFRVGCLSLDALFQSTFSCLYNETCLDLMRTAIYYSKPIPVKILIDSSLSSRNITIETYVSQLFVTKWFPSASFDRYFNECTPELCQYSYLSKFNQVYFVTTVFALFGGLKEGLYFVVSCVAILVIKLYQRRKRNQVASCSQQPNIAVVHLDDKTLEIALIQTTTTVQVTTTPIREQIKSSKNFKELAIMICLCLLVIAIITIVSLLWLRDKTITPISTTVSTTMITNTIITESTTTKLDICYMKLEYQPGTYPIGLGGKSLIVADFNKDSIPDLAVTNYANHTISVLFGNGNGTFQMQQVYSTGNKSYPSGIAAGDFDNDTFLDLAVTLSKTDTIVIFFGIASNGSFTTLPYTFIVDPYLFQAYNAIEASDLNDDGFTDLVIFIDTDDGGGTDSLVCVALNLGDGRQYRPIYMWWFERQIDSIVIGDFDNDGRKNDISACNLLGIVVTLSSIEYTDGTATVSKGTENKMYAKPQSFIRGKFNDDEFDDLALISPQSDTLQVLLAYGDGTFTQQIYSTDRYPTSVARINFNNDSIDDLAILSCNQTVSIYLGTKLGIFRENIISFPIGENNNNEYVHSLRVADFNQDGKDDLVFIDSSAQSVRVLLGTNCDKDI